MKTLVRPELLTIGEYTLKQHPYRIKLNQNENPFELPMAIKEEILRRVASERWSRYPAFVPQRQIDAVASFVGWEPGGVLLGNGSNELLQVLFTAVLGPGRTVVISQPTFTLYTLLAQGLGAYVRDVLMDHDLDFDPDAIVAAAQESHAAMVVLCAPNNPTGTPLRRRDLLRILNDTDALIVVDEAYVQFARESHVPLLTGYDRLVILQTFSKAMGAAGLRFGYALMAPPLARQVEKLKLPYNINIFTLIAAEVLIDRWSTVGTWIETLKKERERLIRRLRTIEGLRVHSSEANFLLVECMTRTPDAVFGGLLAHGILVRDVTAYPMLERGLRITVGSPDDNDLVVTALKRIV